jgi:hypothetical protein
MLVDMISVYEMFEFFRMFHVHQNSLQMGYLVVLHFSSWIQMWLIVTTL